MDDKLKYNKGDKFEVIKGKLKGFIYEIIEKQEDIKVYYVSVNNDFCIDVIEQYLDGLKKIVKK